jgi:uncharacterized protein YndB with AHSA1/START domain
MAPKTAAPQGAELEIVRTFDAPRETVWRAWTEVERLARWWGPKGFEMLSTKLDLRPGGMFHYGMRAPNGHEMWGRFVYRDIVAPERLTYVVSFSDPEGGVTRAPFHPGWPLEVLTTVTFAEEAGRTTLTLRGRPVDPSADQQALFESWFPSMRQGFGGTMDQLAEYLAGAQARSPGRERVEVTETRTLPAPRDLVFRLWTEPKHLARWWGPHHFTNPRCEFDARPGGAIHIDMRAPDGTVYPMTGSVREVSAPDRLVFVSVALDADGAPLLESVTTVTFEDAPGGTKLTVQASGAGATDLGWQMVQGMEPGWRQSLERLAGLAGEVVAQ